MEEASKQADIEIAKVWRDRYEIAGSKLKPRPPLWTGDFEFNGIPFQAHLAFVLTVSSRDGCLTMGKDDEGEDSIVGSFRLSIVSGSELAKSSDSSYKFFEGKSSSCLFSEPTPKGLLADLFEASLKRMRRIPMLYPAYIAMHEEEIAIEAAKSILPAMDRNKPNKI